MATRAGKAIKGHKDHKAQRAPRDHKAIKVRKAAPALKVQPVTPDLKVPPVPLETLALKAARDLKEPWATKVLKALLSRARRALQALKGLPERRKEHLTDYTRSLPVRRI